MPTEPLPIYWHKDRDRWRVHLPDGRKVTLKREDGTPFAHCARWHPDLLNTARAILEGATAEGNRTLRPGHVQRLRSALFQIGQVREACRENHEARSPPRVNQFLAEHGEKRVTKLERKHVRAMMDDLAGKPGAQRTLITVINSLIEPAIEDGLITSPTKGFDRPTLSKTGWRDWPEELIEQYEAHFPIGHDARLSLGFGIFGAAAQRRYPHGQATSRGRQDRGHATEDRNLAQDTGAPGVDIATRSGAEGKADLPRQIEGSTLRARARSANTFGYGAAKPGFQGYTFHGLRKVACRLLPKPVALAPEIMAISGHKFSPRSNATSTR